MYLRGIKPICYTWKFVGSYFTSMNLTEWWLDDKTNFTLTFLLFFPAYLSYSYMVLDNHTFRDLHGYRNSLMLGPQNQDFLPKINMLKRNYCILWIQWMTVCQKVTKSDLKNEISTSRIIENFLIFFSIKNDSLFRGAVFVKIISWISLKHFMYFPKSCLMSMLFSANHLVF